MSSIQLLLFVAVTLCSNGLGHRLYNLPAFRPDPELDHHWTAFKTAFKREYESTFEMFRRSIWESNLKLIRQHNLEYDMGLHTYSLGMNEFGDLTHEEFKSHFLKKLSIPARNSSRLSVHSEFLTPLNLKTLPDSVDWRTQGYVTPIKDQIQCGSCWAFSAVGSVEGQYFRKSGVLVSLSEQQLVDCSDDFGNQGCNGGEMDNSFEYIKKYGIESEEDYPYSGQDGQCNYDPSKVVTKISAIVDIPQFSESKLQEAVATVGPVSVAIDASKPSFQFYSQGVYNELHCSQTNLDHGVLAVGYGTVGAQDYWIVKNSWGLVWGMHGYINMSRNKNNQCGIATSASYPLI